MDRSVVKLVKWSEDVSGNICSVFLGGGHLHSEGRGPDLHLTVLPASEEERLHPRSGHLLQHRVHSLPQEDRLLHQSVGFSLS